MTNILIKSKFLRCVDTKLFHSWLTLLKDIIINFLASTGFVFDDFKNSD